MTPAEVKKRVLARLTDGWGRAVYDDDVCAYRMRDSRHEPAVWLACAVGCLISDEAYDARIEGAGMNHLEVRDGQWVVGHCDDFDSAAAVRTHHELLAKALTRAGVPATQAVRDFLVSAQRVHDHETFWDPWHGCVEAKHVAQLDRMEVG